MLYSVFFLISGRKRENKLLAIEKKKENLDRGRTDRIAGACSEEKEEQKRGTENESGVTNGCW